MQPRNTPLPWVPPAVYHHRTRDCHRLLRAGLRQPSATPWSRLQEQSACGEGAVRSWSREWREARLNHRMSVYTASRGGSALSRGLGHAQSGSAGAKAARERYGRSAQARGVCSGRLRLRGRTRTPAPRRERRGATAGQLNAHESGRRYVAVCVSSHLSRVSSTVYLRCVSSVYLRVYLRFSARPEFGGFASRGVRARKSDRIVLSRFAVHS